MTTPPQADYTACSYGADAERTHPHGDQRAFNESVYINFIDPVSRLGGLVRIGNRPTLGYREASVQLTLPDGSIAFRAGREQSIENGDFSTQGLSIAVEDPTRRWSAHYRNSVARVAQPWLLAEHGRMALKTAPADVCEIDLVFDATTPMFVLEEDGSGDATPGESTIATDHYEQFGSVSGTVKVGSRTWVLESVTSMRDHSWGPREWASFTGEWLCVALADGTRITAYSETSGAGLRSFGGTVVTPDGMFHQIREFTVYSDYDGAATYDGRYLAVLQADGLPTLPLDGTIRHVVPVTQRTEDRGVRMAQLTLDFVGGRGGWGLAEFLRPIKGERA